MVKLEIWQKTHWLRLHKERLRWEAKHPGKFRPTTDPFETLIGRYTCALCGERRYYQTSVSDKDMPQYHRIGKRSITLCHACWHLKGIYKQHQKEKSSEGLSGCRVCRFQLAEKLARKRSKTLPKPVDTPEPERLGETKPGPTDRKQTRVYRSVGLSAGRNGRANVSGKRPAGRSAR